MARIVVAIGGNALGQTPSEQTKNLTKIVPSLADLIQDGTDVVLTHGNGPQVGIISTAFEVANRMDQSTPLLALPESTAMSQGYIGYHLQQILQNELFRRGINRPVVSLVTQVLVDKDDPAFLDPSKPIGVFVDENTAKRLMTRNSQLTYKEDSGRGWRKVVASPNPIRIIETGVIEDLVQRGVITIACGGGGIPVISDNSKLVGVEAVVDKDLASAKLADSIGAEQLIILTSVSNVKLFFNTVNEVDLHQSSPAKMRQYASQGHFAPGSMLPKVQAAITFVGEHPQRQTLITSYDGLRDPEGGTIISNRAS